MKWRVEYQLSDPQDIDTNGSVRKRWRIYAEGVAESTEVFTLEEARRLVPENHPCLKHVNWIMRDTRERLVLRPYEAFVLDESVVKAMGEGFVDRILARDECCKVWASADGWTWLHYPGDAAR